MRQFVREDRRIFFSVSSSAQSIYNDIDKTMLGRLSTMADTGIYGAAYRFIDVSMTPVRSLISAAYPRFFKIGAEDGFSGTKVCSQADFEIRTLRHCIFLLASRYSHQ